MRPRGAQGSEVQLAYLVEVLCPQIADIAYCRRGIAPKLWRHLIKEHKAKSLRELAKEYGISHETVRRTLKNNE